MVQIGSKMVDIKLKITVIIAGVWLGVTSAKYQFF